MVMGKLSVLIGVLDSVLGALFVVAVGEERDDVAVCEIKAGVPPSEMALIIVEIFLLAVAPSGVMGALFSLVVLLAFIMLFGKARVTVDAGCAIEG